MTAPILFVLLGILCGRFVLGGAGAEQTDMAITLSLGLVVLCAGVDIGSKKIIFRKLAEYRAKILLLPLAVLAGSLLGGALLGIVLGMPINEAMSVAAGMGYYSLSSGILTGLGGAHLGSLAFVTNMLREMLSLVLVFPIARWMGKLCAIAPAGAASMDTALGVISRSTDEEVTMLSMISGVVLSILVPVCVPLLYLYL